MGGKLWPIMHSTLVFALVLTQTIALGVFTIKHATISSGFTVLLIIGTVLFHQYCRHRFSSIFNSFSAQVSMKNIFRQILSFEMEASYGDFIEVEPIPVKIL